MRYSVLVRLRRLIPRLALLLIASLTTTVAIASIAPFVRGLPMTTRRDAEQHHANGHLRVMDVTSRIGLSAFRIWELRDRDDSTRFSVSEAWTLSQQRPLTMKRSLDTSFRGSPQVNPALVRRLARRYTFTTTGWPIRCFYGWQSFAGVGVDDRMNEPTTKKSGGHFQILRSRYPQGGIQSDESIVYLPMWRGLILNTLFYAAIWWALLAIPRLIRRTLRVRRGLCPRCAYDMRGLTNAHCPECGPP